MNQVDYIFKNLEDLTKKGNENHFLSTIFLEAFKIKETKSDGQESTHQYDQLKHFLSSVIKEIDKIGVEIKNNDILISVKNQRTIRTCYEIITSFGILPCLIPGLGISLSKRCMSAQFLPQILLSDEQKYEILVICTDFLHRSYEIPSLKNIIITYHLSDYLAALIQLAFAPLKKPGVYPKFTMTEEMFQKLNNDRKKYVEIYEYLINNCFQPKLFKELLILQSLSEPTPPVFAKKVLSKEMSRRLTAPGGLLSLIRCFIETHDLDTGVEWKKIDTICKIVSSIHGNMSENDYVRNMVTQLKQILLLNNEHYLATAVSCLWSLFEKFNGNDAIINLVNEVFRPFDYDSLIKCNLPGTIILTPQEVEHNIQILHACSSMTSIDLPPIFQLSNLYVLFLLRIKSTKDITSSRLNNIIIKDLEALSGTEVCNVVEEFLFGRKSNTGLVIDEYEAGLVIKCCNSMDHPTDLALPYFLNLFNVISDNSLVRKLFESSLNIFIHITNKRQKLVNNERLLNFGEELCVATEDEHYAQMLHILAELSASQKIVNALKADPLIVLNLIENILLNSIGTSNDECITIALVLLNTVLSNTKTKDLEERLHKLLPTLKIISENNNEYIKILSKETISLILLEYPKTDSAFERVISNVFDKLLPVRAHGIIELTKLIDKADPETISKRHYILCLLQEQLKDSDSYIYLSAINGIAALGTHCTSDVLSVLCKEYLELSLQKHLDTVEEKNKLSELRMKIGDIIVKVTKKLGEMAVVHKTILLNTMLSVCKDDDPLIRASALSNLAEISLVINYKIGTIIYEVLLCVWSIIETDKAIECRRAGVMVIASLIKGLGNEMLVELKENLLPIYRTLNRLYKDTNEDTIVKLHAQIALEELNDIVKQFLTPQLPIEKNISILNNLSDIVFK